jgi:hypothetical protein
MGAIFMTRWSGDVKGKEAVGKEVVNWGGRIIQW